MRSAFWLLDGNSPAGFIRLATGLLSALVLTGCETQLKIDFNDVTEPPTVNLIQPPIRDIVRTVGQPSFINSYERTSIYPKMSAYIEKWIVDISI